MTTSFLSLRNLVLSLLLGLIVVCGGASLALAQDAPDLGSGTSVYPAENAFQTSGCSILSGTFTFNNCVVGPLARWARNAMLSMGGSILQMSGAVFDFSVNHVIINFQDTLQTQMGVMPVINGGWTFFRDIANIIMIGMLVFIAISLILGLKEYGQKKLIARVLIIAVLMNFSLLFTKIIIDSSNFLAYAIYTQTAGAGATAGAPRPFSVADKILAPMRILGVYDSDQQAPKVYKDPNGSGAALSLTYGILGFLILTFLAAIIFYGAFLIIARAILFVVLMLSAPLAYVTYLAPHFEASQFGWSNWWRSLINNAAFAPLLMIFLSISILIFQSATPVLGPNGTMGDLLADPSRQVLADGWRILFMYFLGTGLLFISFRLSSSLAGSISGIRMGQAAMIVPFAFGSAFTGRLLQRTAGAQLSKAADSKGVQLKQARMTALQSGKAEDWARVEQLRKQKDLLDKGSRSSFNLMNTQLGKALAGSAGLKGKAAGETKGNFKEDMTARAVAAEERAKQTQVTTKDKSDLTQKQKEVELEKHKTELKDAATKLETANKELEKARLEQAAANDPTEHAKAEKQVTQNKIDRAPEMEKAKTEARVIEKEKQTMVEGHNNEVQKMAEAAEKMSGDARDKQIRAIESRKAEHQQAIKAIDQRITDAHEKVKTIDVEINTPAEALLARQKKAAQSIEERETEVKIAQAQKDKLEGTTEKDLDRRARENVKPIIETAERHAEQRIGDIAADESKRAGYGIGTARILGGGEAGAHIVEHHLEEKFKKRTGSESIAQALKDLKKGDSTDHA